MKCEIEVEFASSADAKTAERVLKSESIERNRSSSKIEAKGKNLVIVTQAKDPAALRASVNNNLRLLSVVTSVK